jgi:hypothetical protein
VVLQHIVGKAVPLAELADHFGVFLLLLLSGLLNLFLNLSLLLFFLLNSRHSSSLNQKAVRFLWHRSLELLSVLANEGWLIGESITFVL